MPCLESGLREALLKDGCGILEALLNQPGALGAHRPEGKLHEFRERRVQSLLGSFTLKRGYYHTPEGSFFPMDEVLGLRDSYTPGLAKAVARAAATDGSFDEAAQTLRIYAGVHVPSSQARRITRQVAGELAAWSDQRCDPRSKEVPTFYVACDGTGVPMRKEETKGRKGRSPDGTSATREVKLGCIFTSHGLDKHQRPVRDQDCTTFVTSFEDADIFGLQLRKEARIRGVAKAQRQVFIGDGAHWIWNVARINFPGAVQILDFYHACEHLKNLADALWPRQAAKIEEALDRWKTCLEEERLETILTEAQAEKPRSGPRKETVVREMNYFRKNSARMKYATLKKEGLFIGSGVVEAGCKNVVGRRTKQSGMFWRVQGAQHILDVRCSVLGGTYDAFWQHKTGKLTKRLDLAA